jgi:hypothetical protein
MFPEKYSHRDDLAIKAYLAGYSSSLPPELNVAANEFVQMIKLRRLLYKTRCS